MPSPDSSQELQFDLRCRDAEWLDRPAVLDDFARSAPTPDPYGPLAELLAADLLARAHYQVRALAGSRAVISCETARYGIPVGVRDLDAPPIDDWLIREVIRGDLIDAAPDGRIERSLTTQLRRGLIAVAGALPLLVSPMLAHAGGARVWAGTRRPSSSRRSRPSPRPSSRRTTAPNRSSPAPSWRPSPRRRALPRRGPPVPRWCPSTFRRRG